MSTGVRFRPVTDLPVLQIRVRGTDPDCGHFWVATTMRATGLRHGETARLACPLCATRVPVTERNPHGREVIVTAVAAIAGRTCAEGKCRQQLSLYNNDDTCWSCQKKAREQAAGAG